MEPNDILAEIDKLELSEKILLVEDIWNRNAESNSVLPMPEWQKTELDKRKEELQSGKAGLKEWNTVHQAIRSEF